jgi:NAD(P)H dehydrogenase (quinone)
MICVVGATGRVGGRLTRRLIAAQAPVRILSRDPERATTVFNGASVDTEYLDYGDPAALRAALRGVDQVFLSHGTSATQVEDEIALIDAAAAESVDHLVKLSAADGADGQRMIVGDWHQQIEKHIATVSLPATLLRPATFTDVLARAYSAVASGTWGGAAGAGLASLIDTRDVADVAYTVLDEGASKHAEKAYRLTGPEGVSMHDVAKRLSALLGVTVKYQERSIAEQAARLTADGLASVTVDVLLGVDESIRDGWHAEPTTAVADITGTSARPVDDWLREHVADFRTN